jgi:hypothetical protein
MDNLVSEFMRRMPSGLSYSDAAQLCLRLYCTTTGVPQIFHSQLSRHGLAVIFAELARVGWIHERGEQLDITASSHWNGVMFSIFKKGPDVVDMARGEELIRQIGFEHETRAA